jgi:hypothetical protein
MHASLLKVYYYDLKVHIGTKSVRNKSTRMEPYPCASTMVGTRAWAKKGREEWPCTWMNPEEVRYAQRHRTSAVKCACLVLVIFFSTTGVPRISLMKTKSQYIRVRRNGTRNYHALPKLLLAAQHKGLQL